MSACNGTCVHYTEKRGQLQHESWKILWFFSANLVNGREWRLDMTGRKVAFSPIASWTFTGDQSSAFAGGELSYRFRLGGRNVEVFYAARRQAEDTIPTH